MRDLLKCAKPNNGHPKGRAHANPALNTNLHLVQLVDRRKQELAHNEMAENMFAGADSEGRQHMVLDQITDHQKSADALPTNKAFLKRGSNTHRVQTTKGWSLLCTWKDKSQDWIPLKALKECHPIEVSECAKACHLLDEPTFS